MCRCIAKGGGVLGVVWGAQYYCAEKYFLDYTSPMNLAQNGIPLDDKSIGAVQLQSKFGLD